MDTPISYARAIAYLGDASKIRARTCDMFGRSPPLFICERIVTERAQRMAPDNLLGAGEPQDTDERPFTVRRLVKGVSVARPRLAVAVVTLPVERKGLDLSIPGELALAICKAFEVTPAAMFGHSRDTQVVAARSVFIRILRERKTPKGEHRFSMAAIAKRVNRNDHTTIRHMLQTYEARAKRFPQMDRVYQELKAMGA